MGTKTLKKNKRNRGARTKKKKRKNAIMQITGEAVDKHEFSSLLGTEYIL